LTEEQHAFVEAIRDFARRECGTREQRDALTDDGREPHNPEIYAKIAELGWLGAAIPEDYGGAGGGSVDLCLLCEEFARGQIPMGFFPVTMMSARPVELFGSDALKGEILPRIVAGTVYAIAMSEPEAGSDVGNVSCRAERVNGGWVINGQKSWITGAHAADHILVVCRSSRTGNKHEGLTMISVPREAPGLEIRLIDTMGGREVNDMYFTDCHVAGDRVVGRPDHAWMQLMAGLNNERLIIAAQALGMAERAFEDALAYVKERKQFGKTIGSFQTLAHRLAELATEIEATRHLVYGVAEAVQSNPGKMMPREVSMAKLKATEVAKRTALEGMQMMGGYGYATEYDMERHVRHTLVMTIYGGTSEIQKEIISRSLDL
jgi:alkylation response protein AidB-like acyl-CoA dehydrogenase